MENRKIRWGLLGAGNILNRWMKGARQPEDMEIAAVASRTRERAKETARRFQIPEALSYEELLARKDIDVVYIPVPHGAHRELALRAMEAGKAVLVEKPAAINGAEFREMTDLARAKGTFLMEAAWTKFFPLVKDLEEWISEKGIGGVRVIQVNFSSKSAPDRAPRLFDPCQAGGGLLDIGVYNLHFCRMLLKKNPVGLTGLATLEGDAPGRQVDQQAAYVARYDRGELAMMGSGIRTSMPDTAWIYGPRGHIAVPHFWKPTRMEVVTEEGTRVIERKVPQRLPGMEDEGFQYEIRHVNQCLRQGLIQSPVMTWEDTLSVLDQCDQLRAKWGLVYPKELGEKDGSAG